MRAAVLVALVLSACGGDAATPDAGGGNPVITTAAALPPLTAAALTNGTTRLFRIELANGTAQIGTIGDGMTELIDIAVGQ